MSDAVLNLIYKMIIINFNPDRLFRAVGLTSPTSTTLVVVDCTVALYLNGIKGAGCQAGSTSLA